MFAQYRGFEMSEDKPLEGVTKFPIKIRFRGEYIDHVETFEAAKKLIDDNPIWVQIKVVEAKLKSNRETQDDLQKEFERAETPGVRQLIYEDKQACWEAEFKLNDKLEALKAKAL
mgnify:CR=1 FL=1